MRQFQTGAALFPAVQNPALESSALWPGPYGLGRLLPNWLTVPAPANARQSIGLPDSMSRAQPQLRPSFPKFSGPDHENT